MDDSLFLVVQYWEGHIVFLNSNVTYIDRKAQDICPTEVGS